MSVTKVLKTIVAKEATRGWMYLDVTAENGVIARLKDGNFVRPSAKEIANEEAAEKKKEAEIEAMLSNDK